MEEPRSGVHHGANPKYGEIRCYIRDPDRYIIEVGQSTDQTYG